VLQVFVEGNVASVIDYRRRLDSVIARHILTDLSDSELGSTYDTELEPLLCRASYL
jgi:hypothetical protein